MTEVFGVTESELLSGVSQASLFDDFSSVDENQGRKDNSSGKMEKKKKKATDDGDVTTEGSDEPGPVTLDRWM